MANGPVATTGKPQPVKTVKVKAHTRTIKPKAAPKQSPLQRAGLGKGKIAYWQQRLPGASPQKILKARNHQIQQHNPQAFGPNTNLSPIQLQQQTNAAVKLQYGPQEAQLNQQLSQVDPVYDAYAKSVQAAQQAAQQAATNAANAINQNTANIEGANDTSRTQLLQQMQADAASRGGSIDPSLFANDQAASASRKALGGTSSNLAQQIGANVVGFLSGQGVLGEAGRVQHKQDLGKQMQTLKGQEGAFKLQQRQNIIGNAQKYGLELGALNLNQTKAQVSANQTAQRLDLAKKVAGHDFTLGQKRVNTTIRGQNINRNLRKQEIQNTASLHRDASSMKRADFIAKYGITPEQANNGAKPLRGVKGSGAGGLTPTQVRSFGKSRDKAVSIMALDPKKPSAQNRNSQIQWANQLTARLNMPHDLAVAVVDKFVFGSVDKKTAGHIYQRYGIHLKTDAHPRGGAQAEPNF